MHSSSVVIFTVLVITLFVNQSDSVFSLMKKRNYIIAKPKFIIKPNIYIGRGERRSSLKEKKLIAAKTLAIGSGVYGVLKKLKPNIKIPLLPRFGLLPNIGLLPKLPISFSVSLQKPKLFSHHEEIEEVEEEEEEPEEEPFPHDESLHTYGTPQEEPHEYIEESYDSSEEDHYDTEESKRKPTKKRIKANLERKQSKRKQSSESKHLDSEEKPPKKKSQ